MPKFIGYTVGLMAASEHHARQLLKVEYERQDDGSVKLKPVSGHNLAPIKNRAQHPTVTRQQFDDRPDDNIEQARWAFGLLGFTIAGTGQQ